ncbi:MULTISPECIES: hypothetical protein [Leptospira]|uniref:hypothetical protein n=1 Tax=Leptospira TaxID=171 RepID=UPI0002929AEA|nr:MULTISPECIES: hypothetical protein [Leptospira]EKO77274.1 hypothetical protein LEP1GSC068_1357 [Leptospira sp. Fiocruz LV3954]EMI63090.1 hypothetical protein LEP1GSC076_0807 [Leptospira sp. Fiocruz LV4135]MDI7206970.1 hypothetical protein [Leptospira santarosai]MDI7230519.1 hypothetical protein [Leptospira santarosai]MDI7237168.1 hypothetical protein [Leptospira santarosai]
MENSRDNITQIQIAETFMKKNMKNRFLEILKKKDRSNLRKFISKENYINWINIYTAPFEEKSAIFRKYNITDFTPVFILSESITFNEKILHLGDAIEEIVGREITSIVSIIPGKLALYESETEFSGFILSEPWLRKS